MHRTDETLAQKPRKKAENFTTSELWFIKKHTKNALNGARLSPKQLMALPKMKRHTKESIATIVKKYHWADPMRSRYIKSGRPLGTDKKRKILAFLKNEGCFWPSRIAAKHLRCSYQQLVRLRSKHHLQLLHSEEAMQDPVYRAWYETREEKRKANQRSAFAKRPRVRHKNLEQVLKKFLHTSRELYPWKKCTACNKNWPAIDIFFRVRKRVSARGNAYAVLLSPCVACPVKKIPFETIGGD